LDNSASTTVLTDGVWREQFGADHNIVGKAITVNERPVTLIGVLPASFDFSSVFTPGAAADLFVPHALSDNNSRSGYSLATIGRLQPGVSIDRANRDRGLMFVNDNSVQDHSPGPSRFE